MRLSVVLRQFGAALLLATLAACAQKSGQPSPYQGVKVGKPYTVLGQSYVPSHQADYEEEGMASWYGPGFHGKKTANGERYDQHDMTAAHRTLPLPSLVEVTNLSNGKKTVVRVNDRGPFAHKRIIDLSKGAAEELGVVRTGTAKVRVKYLDRATVAYLKDRDNHDYVEFAKLDSDSSFYEGSSFANNTPARDETIEVASNDNPYVTNDVQRSAATSNNFKKSNNWLSWAGVGEANADELKAAPAGSVNSYELPPLKGTKVTSQELPPIGGTARKTATASLPDKLDDTNVKDYKAPLPSNQPKAWQEAVDVQDDSDDMRSAPIMVRDKPAPVVPFGKSSPPLAEEEMAVPSYSSGTSDDLDEAVPAQKSQSVTTGSAYIQVGAFGKTENAQKAVNKLVSFGRAEIIPAGNLSRVRLGPLSGDEASATLQKIQQAGFSDAKIIKP